MNLEALNVEDRKRLKKLRKEAAADMGGNPSVSGRGGGCYGGPDVPSNDGFLPRGTS